MIKIFQIITLLALLGVASEASATVTLTLDAELLKTAPILTPTPNPTGNPMATGRVAILVADTAQNGFAGPSTSGFTSGDDLIVATFAVGDFGDGTISNLAGNLTLQSTTSGAAGWSPNDPLTLFWFPTLTSTATAPTLGTPYGMYTDSTGLNGSQTWVTPADGNTRSLKFFTADSTLLNNGGANPAIAGTATRTVAAVSVPEPSTYAMLGLAAAGLLLHRRRLA